MNKKLKITKKECDAFLETIAEIKPWDTGMGEFIDGWYSKIDGSFITFTNISTDIAWMLHNGITEQIQSAHPEAPITAQIGFNPQEQKWYGWSHRAFYGFGIGHTVKKGHAGYQPVNIDDFIEESIRFWTDESHKDVSAIAATNDKGDKGVQVTWIYSDNVINEQIRGTVGESFDYLGHKFSRGEWGKGEWTATTIEDAKQMAIDFAESVS